MIRRLDSNAFLQLLDRLREAVWFREPGGRILYMNRAFQELFDVTAAELEADPRAFLEAISPEHRQTVIEAGAQAAEGHVEVECDVRVADERRRVRTRVGPLHDPRGALVAISGTAVDVTSEVRYGEWRDRLVRAEVEREEALEGLAGLRSVLDRITDGFMAVDRDWRFIYVNRRFEELLGVEGEDMVGQRVFERFPEFRNSKFHVMYERAMREDRTVRFEAYWPPRDLWAEIHAYPAEDGLSVFVHDVTEQRRLEVELREATTRERKRVGAELHDSVGQKLTGATLLTRALQARAAAGEVLGEEELGSIGDVLDGLVAETRRISRGLFPVELQGESLAAALESMGQEVGDLFGVRIRVEGSSRITFPSETELHLFRIAQELTTNAVKHSGATQLIIGLDCTPVGVELRLDHDGEPSEPDGQGGSPSGLGMRSLEYRVRTIDATLEASPRPGGGSRVVCRIPL